MSIRNGAQIAQRNDRRKRLKEYEAEVEKGALSFLRMGEALGRIRKEGLFEEQGHASFDEYVEARFDLSRRSADRMISAARVVLMLGPMGPKIKNERAARELVVFGLDTEKMQRVIDATEARAGKLTAALIREVREELYPETKVIDGEVIPDRAEIEAPKSPLVEAMTQAIEDAQTAAEPLADIEDPADGGEGAPFTPEDPPASGPVPGNDGDGPGVTPELCEKCGGSIDADQVVQGYARCDTCDTDGEHVRPELDEGGRGPCGKCNPAPEEPAGFTARQREDAARQLGYLDSGGLTVTGAVKHFTDVDCAAAEEQDEAPRWASTLATTTCRDCLNVVAQDSSPVSSETVEAPAGQPQVPDVPEVVPIVAMDQSGIEPPIAVGEAPTHTSVPVAGVQPHVDDRVAVDGDEVEGEAGPSPSTGPLELVARYEAFVDWLDSCDADVIGPLFTDALQRRLDDASAEIQAFPTLLRRWREQP